MVLFHPRTAAMRSLDSGFMYYFTTLYFLNNPPVWPIIPRGRHSRRSIPLRLIQSPHWMCFYPPPSPPAPPLPLPPLPNPFPIPTTSPLPVPLPFSNQCPSDPTSAGTLSSPPFCVVRSHRSRIGRVEMYCATMLCLFVIDFRISANPASFVAPAREG